jgi:transposase-like protein
VSKMFQTCGSATLSESERTSNASKGSDDHPSVHCPYCQETDIVKHGLSAEGKQRYRCRTRLEGRGRPFLLEYSYAGQSPAVKQQIVDMAMNASGIRDTARVLHISPTTVLKELKKTRVANLTREQYNGLLFAFLRVQKGT